MKFNESLEIGKKFEKYVKNLFDPEYFEIIQESESYAFDDLDLLIQFKNTNHRFWVECRYRSDFEEYNHYGNIFHNIKWSNNAERDFYKFTQKREQVFLAIGIGRSPEKPYKFYFFNIWDFDDTNNNFLYRDFYQHFELDPEKKLIWTPRIIQSLN